VVIVSETVAAFAVILPPLQTWVVVLVSMLEIRFAALFFPEDVCQVFIAAV